MRYILIFIAASFLIVGFQSAYSDQLPADMPQSSYCTSVLKQAEGDVKAIRKQLDSPYANQAKADSASVSGYNNQLRLAYLYLVCGKNEDARQAAGDLLDMSPGESEPFLIMFMSFAEAGDSAGLYQFYKLHFKKVAEGPGFIEPYYKHLAFLIIRGVLCDSRQPAACEDLRDAKYKYYFPKDTPASMRAVVQALAEYKQPSESDLRSLPEEVSATRYLVLFIEDTNNEVHANRKKSLNLLREFALSNSGYAAAAQ